MKSTLSFLPNSGLRTFSSILPGLFAGSATTGDEAPPPKVAAAFDNAHSDPGL